MGFLRVRPIWLSSHQASSSSVIDDSDDDDDEVFLSNFGDSIEVDNYLRLEDQQQQQMSIDFIQVRKVCIQEAISIANDDRKQLWAPCLLANDNTIRSFSRILRKRPR